MQYRGFTHQVVYSWTQQSWGSKRSYPTANTILRRVCVCWGMCFIFTEISRMSLHEALWAKLTRLYQHIILGNTFTVIS